MTGEKREMDVMRRRHAAIQRVPCTYCGAREGKPCRAPSGHLTPIPHQSRRIAAREAGFLPLKEDQ